MRWVLSLASRKCAPYIEASLVGKVCFLAQQRSYGIHNRADISFRAGAASANFPCFVHQLFRDIQGDNQNGYFRRTLGDDTSGIETVHLGHLEIKYDQIRANLPEPVYCIPTVARFVTHSPIIMLLQNPAQIAPYRRVVIHHEDTNYAVGIFRRQFHQNTTISRVCAAQTPRQYMERLTLPVENYPATIDLESF